MLDEVREKIAKKSTVSEHISSSNVKQAKKLINDKLKKPLFAKSFISIAKDDLRAFVILFEAGLKNQATFFLCQAIEKTLKSRLPFNSQGMRLHSIQSLTAVILGEEKATTLEAMAKKADKLYLITRYPAYNFSSKTGKYLKVSDSEIDELVALLNKIKNFLK